MNPNTGQAPGYYIPAENEWYKAAYYSPDLAGGAGDYWVYATQSITAPGNLVGSGPNQVNYVAQGLYAMTQQLSLDIQQNYLTAVGAFTRSRGPFGTFDMNGGVWEWDDMDGSASPNRIIRGGGWTSYDSYLQSDYRLGNAATSQSSNVGFRLASPHPPGDTGFYQLVKVGHPGNRADKTGYGRVDQPFWIGQFEVSIGQYTAFLNAVAKSDAYGLYSPEMGGVLNSAGIQRSGESGQYHYAALNNGGDSAKRPITYVSWFDTARFANWLANGRPSGLQDSSTTENGAYPLLGRTSGLAVPVNHINPNTGAPPDFVMPTEDQWYKAAYYSPRLNGGRGAY